MNELLLTYTFSAEHIVFLGLGFLLGILLLLAALRKRAMQLAIETSSHSMLKVQADKLEQQLADQVVQATEQTERNQKLQVEQARLVQLNLSNQQRMHEMDECLVQERQQVQQLRSANTNLKTENAELAAQQQEQIRSMGIQQKQFIEQKEQLSKEFENMAHKIFDEKGKRFSDNSHQALGALLTPFREQISEFRQRVDTLHKQSNESNADLKAQLDYLKNLNQQVTEDAQNLTRALKGDKKLSGSWGEIQLERSLQYAGLVSGEHYLREESYDTPEGAKKRPDFVINLPDGKHIVIDSKVSLIAYENAVSAKSEEEKVSSLDLHIKALKRHIDGLSEKDYSNLIGLRSPNFVLMFMPIEPAYIEALKHNSELFNYGYDKNIILVSHTTLMPILRTVTNLWMVERSNKETREIGLKAGDIYNQVCIVADRFSALGKTLNAASGHYNKAVLALAGKQGLYGKVERFSEIANNVTKVMPVMEPQHIDYDYDKLSLSAEPCYESEPESEPGTSCGDKKSSAINEDNSFHAEEERGLYD